MLRIFGYRPVDRHPVRDCAPICGIATVTQVLVASPASGIRSVEQLIANAKREPGGVQYASAGKGSTSHLTMELFAQSAGLTLDHIPYKGGPPAQADIMGGRVPVMFDSAPGVLAAIQAGNLVAIGVSSRQRLSLLPGVPTIAESGVPGFETVGWIGLFAPAGTPPNAIAVIHEAAVAALNEPRTRARFLELGFMPVGDTPVAFGQYVRSEVAMWGRVIASAKITIE